MLRYRRDDAPPATLTDALESQRVDTLGEYLGALRGKVRSTGRKSEVVAEIRGELRGDRLRAAGERLDELGRAAVAEAVHDPRGTFRAALFKAKYGAFPAWHGKTGKVGDFARGRATLVAVFLQSRQLPVDSREELLGFVPEPEAARLSVQDALPETHDLPRRDDDADTESMPLEVRETERAARNDLRAILGLVEALDDSPYDYDPVGPMRAFAWPLLLQAAGLTSTGGKRLELSKTGRKALTEPAGKTLRTVWRRWQKTTLLDQFRRIEAIEGQPGKGKRGFTAVAGRREAIEPTLRQCPIGA